MADERHDAAFVVGAILGGVLGGGYALLNAPQSGAETRAELAARWKELTGRVAGAVAGVEDEARRLAAGAGEAVAPLTDRLSRDRAETAAAVEVVEGGVRVTVETEPVLTLPDPLEPDPIVPDEPSSAAGDGAGGAEDTTVDARAAELDVVVEGTRRADPHR